MQLSRRVRVRQLFDKSLVLHTLSRIVFTGTVILTIAIISTRGSITEARVGSWIVVGGVNQT